MRFFKDFAFCFRYPWSRKYLPDVLWIYLRYLVLFMVAIPFFVLYAVSLIMAYITEKSLAFLDWSSDASGIRKAMEKTKTIREDMIRTIHKEMSDRDVPLKKLRRNKG